MRKSKTFTFTVTYNYFEPGTLVVPTSSLCALARIGGAARVFEVTQCHGPLFSDVVVGGHLDHERATAFVAGYKTGVDTTDLREATREELALFTRFA